MIQVSIHVELGNNEVSVPRESAISIMTADPSLWPLSRTEVGSLALVAFLDGVAGLESADKRARAAELVRAERERLLNAVDGEGE